MIKRKILKLIADFKDMTPTAQGLVVLCIILIIGILLRWEHVISEIAKGFDFFSGKQ